MKLKLTTVVAVLVAVALGLWMAQPPRKAESKKLAEAVPAAKTATATGNITAIIGE